MPFHQVGDIRFYCFEHLSRAGVTHAIFTRRGGVSPTPWRSLNLNWSQGDRAERVLENHRRAFQALGRELASLADARQVHRADVFVVDSPAGVLPPAAKPQADSLLTDNPEVTLWMRYADCVPVLLYAPNARVVGIVHSGWRGTVQRAAAAAVRVMQTRFGAAPASILAGIGPAICAAHYPVGAEVVEQVRQAFGAEAPGLFQNNNGAIHLDLWAANRQVLAEVGVEQIEVAQLCTACDLDNWFSYRGERRQTGGFAAAIAPPAAGGGKGRWPTA